MNKILIVIFASCIAVLPTSGQSFLEEASANANSKLESSLERLSAMREFIGDEKIPLTSERDKLFASLRTLRSEADRAQRLSDNQGADLSNFESALNSQAEVVDYLISLSAEFGRTLGAQLDPSEYANYSDVIAGSEVAAEDPYLAPLEKLRSQKLVLEAGIDRMEALVGGAMYPGKAITQSGLLEDGTFIRFGPVTYFASESGIAGLVQQGQSVEPVVLTIADGAYDRQIASVAKGEIANLPLDSTLNNAMAIAATKETLMDHISKGGIWIYPILMFAFLSLVVAAFKAFEIIMLPKPKEGMLAEVLSKLAEKKKSEAASIANTATGPMGKMIQQGVRYSEHDPDLVEEILYESMVETQPKVMRLLPFISVTAAVAPLLGLLGTVTGMINTFNRIKIFGTGDAKSLSGGISEALITTEFGLIVAIPSLLLYAILSRKAKGYLARMEKMSISFINGIKTIS